MKQFIYAIFVLGAAYASAQPAPPAVDGKNGGDRVQFVGVEQMPVPIPRSEMERVQRAKGKSEKAEDGFSMLERSPDKVRSFFNALEIAKTSAAPPPPVMTKQGKPALVAPVVYKDLTRMKLAFAPAQVSKGELIGVAPHGTMIKDAWTGVERFYRIDGTGYMRLTESDMGLTGGMFYMIKSNINTSVGGKPAISVVFVDDGGQTVEEILWVNGSKLYTLTFAPEMSQGRFGKVKENARVSAPSLAQELR